MYFAYEFFIHLCKYFHLFCSQSLYFLESVFWSKKFLILWCPIYFFLLSFVLLMSYLRGLCLTQDFLWCLFSSKGFIILALIFRSLIHFEVSFYMVWGEGTTSMFYTWICGYFNTVSSSIEWCWHFLKKLVDHKCKHLFLDFHFCSIDLYVYPYDAPTFSWLL